jgi:hypothetical protein
VLLPPADIVALLSQFAPLFSRRVWRHIPLLVVGAILTPGRRLVSSVLRTVGLSQEQHFQTYHRALNRAVWSSLAASRILLRLLVSTFVPSGPVVLGIDETIERRRGVKIAAAGIYRDPVRSSHSHFVKVSGLRWVCLMLLVPIPWAGRVWALPFLSALAPSERYTQRHGCRHQPVPLWARQLIRLVHRWLPDRSLVVVGDRGYAALDLLDAVRPVATVITRLRLDARLVAPPPPRLPRQNGRPRIVGPRLPTLDQVRTNPATVWTSVTLARWYSDRDRRIEYVSGVALWYHTGFVPVPIQWVLVRDPLGKFATQALLCTDQEVDPVQILLWFARRWQMEVTFHEVRAHLGVETQRQWSERAIARTTPVLMGLFSLVTLVAHEHYRGQTTHLTPVHVTAWYKKASPTFSDALALVRRHLWTQTTFPTSLGNADDEKAPRALLTHLADLLCYAA